MAETLGDPRVAARSARERDIRPIVELPRSGPSRLTLTIAFAAAGLLLFSALNARRGRLSAPPVPVRTADGALTSAPAQLYLPPEPVPETPPIEKLPPEPVQFHSSPQPAPAPQPTIVPPQIVYQPQPIPSQTSPPPPREVSGPALVLDLSQGRASGDASAAPAGNAAGSPDVSSSTGSRVRAGAFANRSMTVPQGTLIPAVLETAFDSTRLGYARALVQQDIKGFDGTRVLIPRGSRLIGEYGADTLPGQNRAMVAWFRLVRPDGATIAIGSPAADPLGRGGVRAKVNSHFFERFAGAILQSSLDIGVNLASSAGRSPVIVALPSAAQSTRDVIGRPADIKPTLKVAEGTSIAVFVARDLDFTEVEADR